MEVTKRSGEIIATKVDRELNLYGAVLRLEKKGKVWDDRES